LTTFHGERAGHEVSAAGGPANRTHPTLEHDEEVVDTSAIDKKADYLPDYIGQQEKDALYMSAVMRTLLRRGHVRLRAGEHGQEILIECSVPVSDVTAEVFKRYLGDRSHC
jgi:hypothetical protein